jgi:cytochrome c1
MKSVLAAAVDNGDSIPKEGEATYGSRQPISLQTTPTKRSRFLIKKIYKQLADPQKVKPGR